MASQHAEEQKAAEERCSDTSVVMWQWNDQCGFFLRINVIQYGFNTDQYGFNTDQYGFNTDEIWI